MADDASLIGQSEIDRLLEQAQTVAGYRSRSGHLSAWSFSTTTGPLHKCSHGSRGRHPVSAGTS